MQKAPRNLNDELSSSSLTAVSDDDGCYWHTKLRKIRSVLDYGITRMMLIDTIRMERERKASRLTQGKVFREKKSHLQLSTVNFLRKIPGISDFYFLYH